MFRLLGNLSGIQPAEGATDLVLAARHAAAMLSGRGVVLLLSDLLDPAPIGSCASWRRRAPS